MDIPDRSECIFHRHRGGCKFLLHSASLSGGDTSSMYLRHRHDMTWGPTMSASLL